MNIRSNTSIGGFTTTDIYNAFHQVIQFGEVNIQQSSNWRVNDPDQTNDKSHYVPLELLMTEFTEAQSQEITATDPMFTASTADRTMRVSGTIEGLINCNEFAPSVSIAITVKVDGVAQATLVSENAGDVSEMTFSGSFDEQITVNTGQVVSIEAFVGGAVADPTTV